MTETTDPYRAGSGRFAPGNPGRPAGSKHAAFRALDAIGQEGAERAIRAVVAAAAGGDMRAAEILLARVWPASKGRPLSVNMPTPGKAADIVAALGAIVAAVTAGEITPEEGQTVAGILEAQRRAIETQELEQRIAALEERK